MKPIASFTSFAYEVISELQQENRFATAHIYEYAVKSFLKSTGGGEIFWEGLTRTALHRFQQSLEKWQKSYNTVSTYIRVLRAIFSYSKQIKNVARVHFLNYFQLSPKTFR